MYHIDGLWQTIGKNTRLYPVNNPFVSNRTDDNHKLKEWSSIVQQSDQFVLLRVHPVLLCDKRRENPQYSFSQCEQLVPPTAGRQ